MVSERQATIFGYETINRWRPTQTRHLDGLIRVQTKGTEFMKTSEPNIKREESTYSLLMRSAEKKRTITEAVVYGLIVLSAMAAVWEFGQELFW
jgi:hypothetical protein